MKKNNGITLIALVITIIVMLILVAVTITIAVNGGLFNYAREAGEKTNEAKDLEQNYVDLADNLSYEDLIGVYSAELNPKGIIPAGCKYTVASTGEELTAGKKFPEAVNTGDIYETEDYAYKYNQWCDEGNWDDDWETDEEQNGWSARVKNKSQTQYDPILYSINNKTVNTLHCTFMECDKLIYAPVIPNNIINMHETFSMCDALVKAPTIPSSVVNIFGTFSYCEKLKGTITINTNAAERLDFLKENARDTDHSITLTGSASLETLNALKATGYNNGEFITIDK